jgi:hypothetical protein
MSKTGGTAMEDRRLRKLTREELLELMLEQSKEIDRLRKEVEEAKAVLRDRDQRISSCDSVAQAAAEVSDLFHAAQDAVDIYILNIRRICEERAAAAGKETAWKDFLTNAGEGA